MCRPVSNSWPVPPVFRSPFRRGAALGFRRSEFYPNTRRPLATLSEGNNLNVCHLARTRRFLPPDIPPFQAGEDGGVVITVSNSNNILDDAWEFAINDVVVCTYDGGGDTTVSFSGDLPPGRTWELTARCITEQNDNLFFVSVRVNGATVIGTDIAGGGDVGEVRSLGSFST